MIRPERMTTALDIQARTETPDGMGGVSITWATVATVRAEMWTVKGEERAASASIQASITHRARIWAYPGLTTAHRMKLGTRSFDIQFVNNKEERGVEYVVDMLEIVGREAQ
ncbi:MAG: Phage head-tail [Desulfovibrionaceae bacterium]|nr:MAG: Phage head-tail [Desulfovibrionaceae bacterium]